MPESSTRRNSLEMLSGGAFGKAPNREASSEIDINNLVPNRDQVRTEFNQESLNGLADSIKASGILQPIVVRKQKSAPGALNTPNEGEKYEIIAGERRWRASKQAGLSKVPVIIKDVPDKGLRFYALLENVQREDLSLADRAKAVADLKAQIGRTDEVALRLGISRRLAFLLVKIGEAPKIFQDLIKQQKLDQKTSETLITIADEVKGKGTKSLEDFLAKLKLQPVNKEYLSELRNEILSNGSDSRSSSSSKKDGKNIKKQGFWKDEKGFHLGLVIKNKEMSEKDKNSLVSQANRFFKAVGAKKIDIRF